MKYAICNETFEGWDHAKVCETVATLGYTGLEVAPFTLAPLITDVTAARRAELRRQAERAGVTIIGTHWLLAADAPSAPRDAIPAPVEQQELAPLRERRI